MSGDTPEERAREKIDEQLSRAGWTEIDNAGDDQTGYVVEVKTDEGFADYILYVNGDPIGVIEAKKAIIDPVGAVDQAARYAEALPSNNQYGHGYSVPFVFSANGDVIRLRDVRADAPSERELGAFHTPEGLLELLSVDYSAAKDWFRSTTPDETDPQLWGHQKEAINQIEGDLQENKRKILIQMATGTGKTRMAAAQAYRLLESGYARRILFIPDTRHLANQSFGEFTKYRTPNGDYFEDEYRISNLEDDESNAHDSTVVITTLQKMYSLVSKRDDHSFDPHEFDLIITDECHRSIYNDYEDVLNLFDATEIGLTATPSQRTLNKFGDMSFTYGYQDAVEDGHVVPYIMHEIGTRITMNGVEDPDTGEHKPPSSLGVSVEVPDTYAKVGEEYRKTSDDDELALVFARNNRQADEIVKVLREDVFSDKDGSYVQKITADVRDPDERLKRFGKTDRNPRIAVTVRLISTGVDIKPLENVILMAPVKSPVLYNQMVGRGTRTAEEKDSFTIYDAVGARGYFNDIPPFNTEGYETTASTPTDSEPGPKQDVKVVDELDEVLESSQGFVTTDGEYLDRAQYREHFEETIQKSRTEHPLSAFTNDDVSVDYDVLEETEVFLREQPEYFTETRLQRAYRKPSALLFDFVHAALKEEDIMSAEDRADLAVWKVKQTIDLTENQTMWLERLRDLLAVDGYIGRKQFMHPPLTDYGGWSQACNDFEGEANLESVLDDLKTAMYNY